jgi:TetR/AcrR family transcriptional regulator
MEQPWSKTFAKLPKERQNQIIETAIADFAQFGYNGTSINKLAARAGISIGALYSYFPSKEALFLTVIHRGYEVLESLFYGLDIEGLELREIFRLLIRSAITYSRMHSSLTQIYLDMSTQALSHLSPRLAEILERQSLDFYRSILEGARDSGQLDSSLDIDSAAYVLDTILMSLQQAFASSYYGERLKIYQGPDVIKKPGDFIEHMTELLMRMCSPVA